MPDLVRTLLDWIDIPSVTGEERDYGDALCARLSRAGFAVERQRLPDGRFNVLAHAGRPQVVLCTHQDTVPPWLPPREDGERVYGRGSCDAKGQAAAMIAAAERLLASREDRIGMLFTVGEETDSAGAAFADRALAPPWDPRFVLIGEPTDGRFVQSGKGIFKVRLTARGVAGHSSQAGGTSAVHELVHCVHRLLSERWGDDARFGEGTLNIGCIDGGVAANVIAAEAHADVLVRTVEPISVVRARVEQCLSPHVQLAETSKAYGPIEFLVPPGEEGVRVAFGTDAPHMPRFGRPLLFGPGSIRDAHTDHEKIEKKDLEASVHTIEATVRELLVRCDA